MAFTRAGQRMITDSLADAIAQDTPITFYNNIITRDQALDMLFGGKATVYDTSNGDYDPAAVATFDSSDVDFPFSRSFTPRPAANLATLAERNRVEALRRDLAAAEQRLAKRIDDERARSTRDARLNDVILAFGPDRLIDGCVIMFNKQFSRSGPSYAYAAMRARGRWYTTGPKSPKSYTWDELVRWMVGSDPDYPGVTEVRVATEAEPLVQL